MGLRSQCGQSAVSAAPPFFLDLSEPSHAVRTGRQKILDAPCSFRQQHAPCQSHFVLLVIPKSLRNSFFSQAAALSTLRTTRNVKPAQRSLRQRSRQNQRPAGQRTTYLLFQSRPARRLRALLLHLSGRRFAPSHVHRNAALEIALPFARRLFHQSSGAVAASDVCTGDDLSFALPLAPTPGRSALPVMPPAESPR